MISLPSKASTHAIQSWLCFTELEEFKSMEDEILVSLSYWCISLTCTLWMVISADSDYITLYINIYYILYINYWILNKQKLIYMRKLYYVPNA